MFRIGFVQRATAKGLDRSSRQKSSCALAPVEMTSIIRPPLSPQAARVIGLRATSLPESAKPRSQSSVLGAAGGKYKGEQCESVGGNYASACARPAITCERGAASLTDGGLSATPAVGRARSERPTANLLSQRPFTIRVVSMLRTMIKVDPNVVKFFDQLSQIPDHPAPTVSSRIFHERCKVVSYMSS